MLPVILIFVNEQLWLKATCVRADGPSIDGWIDFPGPCVDGPSWLEGATALAMRAIILLDQAYSSMTRNWYGVPDSKS